MQENPNKDESKQLLGEILQKTFDCGDEIPFEDLLKQIDEIKSCRECSLEEAEQRLIRLLHSTANTQLQ